MVCGLVCVKPLPEPMLKYCLSDPGAQTSGKIASKYNNFHTREWIKNVVCKIADICLSCNSLTHLDLVMPYGHTDMDQQWLR